MFYYDLILGFRHDHQLNSSLDNLNLISVDSINKISAKFLKTNKFLDSFCIETEFCESSNSDFEVEERMKIIKNFKDSNHTIITEKCKEVDYTKIYAQFNSYDGVINRSHGYFDDLCEFCEIYYYGGSTYVTSTSYNFEIDLDFDDL